MPRAEGRKKVLMVALWLSVTWLALAQAAPVSAPPVDAATARQLMLTGRIVRVKTLSKGVTRPRRVTLTDGTLTHDAVFQSVDEAKPVERFAGGRVEIDFRDSYHFNIAAWELARLVGLDGMVPQCVERALQRERGSLCWWVTSKWDEQERVKQKLRPPDPVDWQQQWDTMRVFRELVDDTDRNQTNMLITEDWRLWMVDFSRAFRKWPELRKPNELRRAPRALLERLRALDAAAIRAAVEDHLRPVEVEGVLTRRRLILQHFDALVAAKGADQVLF
jgi:hypothetical protein